MISEPSSNGQNYVMKNRHFTVILDRDEDGRFLAICPALEGCYTEGETVDEALQNVREAIEAHIESRRQHGEPIPHEG